MTELANAPIIRGSVAELLQLFGPAPILPSESIESYTEVMTRFLESFAPRDFMEQLFVKELMDSTLGRCVAIAA
jgi:hypothetical protein